MSSERTPTNIRALLIMEVLSGSDRAMTPTEVAAELDLPKQSAHRLCMALIEKGFLSYDATGKKLRPSVRTRKMANGLLHSSQFHMERRNILKEIARTVGETVNFVVPNEDGMRYRDRVETDWAFRIQLPVGSDVPFHCTASGKTYLASLTPMAQKKRLANLDLERLTENTITQPDAMIKELKLIKKQGYATDREEFMEGMVAVAVPIADPNGRYFGAVAYHGPRQRLTDDQLLNHLENLQHGAQKLTQLMFDE